MFPVDLPDVDETELESTSAQFISSLESRENDDEWFDLSRASKVKITTNNVKLLKMFEDDGGDCSLVALHLPDQPTQVVALFVHEKFWRVDDLLRTSSETRDGLLEVRVCFHGDEQSTHQINVTRTIIKDADAVVFHVHVSSTQVKSMAERLVVFLLSRVVDASQQQAALFSLHPRTERCKVLWRDGEAVAFYTVKHKGSLCDGYSSCCYFLPVLDTILVRSSHRRRGFGLQMLQDFCSTFPNEEFLGISSPLSPSMAAVCEKFLQQHDEHRERLYEVEAPGDWSQRRNIWLNIKLGRYSVSTDAS